MKSDEIKIKGGVTFILWVSTKFILLRWFAMSVMACELKVVLFVSDNVFL